MTTYLAFAKICQSANAKLHLAIANAKLTRMTKSAFAQRLLTSIDAAEISMADLARKSGVPYHQIHTWTRRENSIPNAESLQKVVKVLGVTPSHLLDGDALPDVASDTHSQLLAELKGLSEEELRILLAAAHAMRAQHQKAAG